MEKRKPLSATDIRELVDPGLYPDRGAPCLYVQVAKGGSRSWVLRYGIDGRRKDMGLGSCNLVSPIQARKAAKDALRLAKAHVDPIGERRARYGKPEIGSAAKVVTFKKCVEAYLTAHGTGWRSQHKAEWVGSVERHIIPAIGSLPVSAVDTETVLRILEPIWSTKPVSARRVRQRLEAVLDYAKARGWRAAENPARWKGHLQNLLAKSKPAVRHMPALPYAEIGRFMVALREREGIGHGALELAILCASRRREVIDARWSEIDTAARLWIIPAERMKGKKEHRVPLSPEAMRIIDRMAEVRCNEYVFPGSQGGALHTAAMADVLKRLGFGNVTQHGFRSAFADWAAERTSFPREVAEMALAHAVGSQVERSYRRTDLFERRRELMDAWSRFCAEAPAQVVPIRA